MLDVINHQFQNDYTAFHELKTQNIKLLHQKSKLEKIQRRNKQTKAYKLRAEQNRINKSLSDAR